MSDVIKRSDAIKAIEELPNAYNGWSDAYDKAYIIGTLEEVPKADRPQGEWIDKGWKGDWQFETDGRGHCWRVFECSVCNGENTIKTRFCPHCGTRMKGADDD